MKLAVIIILFLTASIKADELVQKLHETNNKIRTLQKSSKQDLSPSLTKAAQDHASYMAKMHDLGEEDFNHRGGNGTPGKRAAYYQYEGTVKENIARGYQTVGGVFEAWLSSSSHREAITSDTTDVGFGIAAAKDGTIYWVAVYGKPRSWELVKR